MPMPYTFRTFLCFLISHSFLFGQAIDWKNLCTLESKLQGISGITSLNGGQSFWVMVDNSSPNEIYEIDSSCHILRTLYVKGNPKRDWEDITSDLSGNLYIGDFGNNNNNRRDLQILILASQAIQNSDTVSPEVITFTYSRQSDYPPTASERNFDMEAMVWAENSIHLFSKNRTDPFTGFTYQYSFPAVKGHYSLEPVDSFKTGDGPMLFYWVTGAAYEHTSKVLALLSHDRLWLFDQFVGSQFFKGRNREIILPTYTQKEGIFSAHANRWYLTDEYNSTLRIGRQLYLLQILPSDNLDPAYNARLQLWPNPVKNLLMILNPFYESDDLHSFNILDLSGRCLLQFTMDQARMQIPMETLDKGFYILKETKGRIVKYFSKLE